MSLELYFHPLSSFCQKALIALYEKAAPFRPHIVDLGDEVAHAEFKRIWPVGKIPVLRDEANGLTLPEASIIVEYVDRYVPGGTRLIPEGAELCLQTRLRDRFYDLYMNVPMQKVVTDKLRPQGKNDPHGVREAQALLRTACGMIDQDIQAKTWAMGETFTMADCAAAPALFYVNEIMPLGDDYENAAAYLGRLMRRPSVARVIEEARPYFSLFPG